MSIFSSPLGVNNRNLTPVYGPIVYDEWILIQHSIDTIPRELIFVREIGPFVPVAAGKTRTKVHRKFVAGV